MPTFADAEWIATALPDVTVGARYGNRTWFVGKHGFAWERPFSKADLRRFGGAPIPAGPILAVRVADLRAKDTLLAKGPRGVFTIAHFDGHPAVLIQLDVVAARTLKDLVTDAWLACAPASLSPRRPAGARTPRGGARASARRRP